MSEPADDKPDVPPGHHTHTAHALDPSEAFTDINNAVLHLFEGMREDPTGVSPEDAAIALVTAIEAMQFVSHFAVSNIMSVGTTLIPPDVIAQVLEANNEARLARSAEEQSSHNFLLVEPYMSEILVIVPDHHGPAPEGGPDAD